MKAATPPGWRAVVTPFAIWFAHFMASWAAGEIWPHQWPANLLAWGATAAALLAMGLHVMRVQARPIRQARLARGAIALATAAVLFGALPSVVFLPAG